MAHSVGPSAVAVLRPPTCCSRGSRSIRPRAFAVTRHWTGNGSFRFPASGPWTLILPNARKDAGFPRGLQASASPRPQSPADDFYYPHGLKPLTPDSLSMAETAAAIEDFSVRPMDSPSRYLSPYSAFYQIRGQKRRWDIVKSLPSVGIVLYHTELDAFLLVRQFRPAVYASNPGSLPQRLEDGFTYEICAGLIDKDKSMLQICREEIQEECGYSVETCSIVPVTTYIGSAGISGAMHNLFAAKVDESMRCSSGGGLLGDGEAIEVLALPRDRSEEFLADLDIPKSAGLVTGTTWALLNLARGSW